MPVGSDEGAWVVCAALEVGARLLATIRLDADGVYGT